MNRIARTTVVACALALLTSFASAAPVLTFNAPYSAGFNQGQTVGWQFNVTAPITVTGVGWFDEFGDGLAVAHTVGIWDPAGVLLRSALVPNGAGAGLDGQFRTVAVAPIVLAPGNGYIVGGENFTANTETLAFNVASQALHPSVTFVDATFSNIGLGFVRPTTFSGADTGFYGPSFSVDIPEPASLGLIGVFGIIARRRRA